LQDNTTDKWIHSENLAYVGNVTKMAHKRIDTDLSDDVIINIEILLDKETESLYKQLLQFTI